MRCMTPPLDQIPIKQWICHGARGDVEEVNNLNASHLADLAKFLSWFGIGWVRHYDRSFICGIVGE